MTLLYDPPSGWRFGFPRPYLPEPNEPLADTLVRDGYPAKDAELGAKYCRFIGGRDELDAQAQQHVEGDNDNFGKVMRETVEWAKQQGRSYARASADVAGDVSEVCIHSSDGADGVGGRDDDADGRGPYITTYTGRFYPFSPASEDVRLEDIIHSLAGMQRFTAHGVSLYSVAEHSVHIYRWLVAQNADLDTRLAGLMHDAPEALSGFGDVARPVKQRAPLIGSTERAIWEQAIAPRFELPLEIPALVHEADTRIIADESAQILHEDLGDDPLGIRLEFWDVDRAKAEFWRAFHQVQCQRQQAARRVA